MTFLLGFSASNFAMMQSASLTHAAGVFPVLSRPPDPSNST